MEIKIENALLELTSNKCKILGEMCQAISNSKDEAELRVNMGNLFTRREVSSNFFHGFGHNHMFVHERSADLSVRDKRLIFVEF